MTVLRRLAATALAPALALVAALAITSLIIAASGGSPGDFVRILLDRPEGPQVRLYADMLNQTAMLYLSALAAAVAFRMNLFNIGVEGQYTVAAYTAAVLGGAALLPGKLNVVVCVLAAMAVGALWAGIAGLLKVTRGVSEVISTIMLNAIGLSLVGYFVTTYGQRTGDSRRTTPLEESSQVGGLGRIGTTDIWTLGLLALVVGVLFWFVITKTRFGFDLRATGMSETAAVASGVKVKRMVLASMLISGAIAGLVWMPALFGAAHSYGTAFQPGLGFVGIAVALLGRNRPVGMLVGAVLFAFLSVQANRLTLEADISPDVIQITQGVIVLTVVVAYEVARRRQAAAEQRAVTRRLESGGDPSDPGPAQPEEARA